MKYTAIRSEGGLLPYDLLDEILAETAPGQKAADFGLPKGRRVSDEIQRVWLDAQELWSRFKAGREKLTEKDPHGTTLTRDRWIGPLLTDPVRLSYDLHYQPSAVVLEGLTFAISHRAGEPADSPPVHIEGCEIELDKRPPKYRTSPQAMVQEFLNRSEPHLWGVVTNGLRFRLLRDSVRTARPTYLEFDLETILEGVHYNEFVLFYRLCHRTRLPQAGHPPEDCWLEKYYQQSIEKGGRVRDKLRDGVEEALKVLGTGFLRHPANTALLEKIDSGKLNADQYHRQLLLLVYRLLFLTVAEDRQLVISIGENAERNQAVYQENYSIGKLRDRAEGMLDDSGFNDLWIGLTETFKLFADSNDTNPLGIPPLNGDLFSPNTIPDLESAHLSNFDLLRAMRWLMFYREGNVQQRVNYAALNVEEFGSVYESLLDFRALISKDQDGRKFELGVGSERKTTGSYYTRPELVRELIQSVLVPVLEDRLAEVEAQVKGQPLETSREAKVKAILGISVCDPACGSGHFLLEAARQLGKDLARIRVGDDEPTPEQFHIAVRDVISHCVHGVDVNPLAVDLCKLALWLEGHWVGKPLSFLDHRIRCGNSLIGVLDPAVMSDGIPDGAFNPVAGDDKRVAASYKKRNKAERSQGQKRLEFEQTPAEHSDEYAELFGVRLDFPEEKPSDVKRKAELFEKARGGADWWHDWTVSNLWTASFFLPLKKLDDPLIPTHESFESYLLHRKDRPQMTGNANSLGEELHFFHWHLEFPDVFENGGFDVVLGNPPWERIKLQEEEHWADDPYISHAGNKSIRTKRMHEYRASEDPLKQERIKRFDLARHAAEAANKFIRESRKFPFTASGDVNTYGLFAELARLILGKHGRAGVIVPTGIATDDTFKEFFGDLTKKRQLSSLFDFENREHLFPAVYFRMKFCLLTISSTPIASSTFAFYLTRTDQCKDVARIFRLSNEDLELLNPNTRTCPIFRTNVDATLTKAIYRRIPILFDQTLERNKWGITTRRIFNMGDEQTVALAVPNREVLPEFFESDGISRINRKTRVRLLPVYEGKMFDAYNHRAASVTVLAKNPLRSALAVDNDASALSDSNFLPTPTYWMPDAALADAGYADKWVVGYKDVTSTTNERTMVASILPTASSNFSVRCATFEGVKPFQVICLLANFNSLIFDYLARQSLAGLHMSDYILQQIPTLPPESINVRDTAYLVPRVMELTYTAWDLAAYATDVFESITQDVQTVIRSQWSSNGGTPDHPPDWLHCRYPFPPFRWDEGRRAAIRAEIDAYLFQLYGLSQKEVQYILFCAGIFGH